MHKNQKLRLIQQICFLLQMPQPAVSTVLQFYHKFEAALTDNEYSNEVVVCSCIFLVSKIFQDEKKIRDILNVINGAIKLYQLARVAQESEQNSSNYIYMGVLLSGPKQMDRQNLIGQVQPTYDLEMYNELKKQVLEAEQVLLKILGFDFSIAQQKSSNYKQLLSVCDQLRLPRNVTQTAVAVYNDLEFCPDVIQWVPGIIFFAFEVASVQQLQTKQKQAKPEQNGQQIRKQEQNIQKVPSPLLKQKKESNQVSIVQPRQLKMQWQKLFLVPLKKLQVYSQKIISHYQKISKQQFENEQEAESSLK